MTGKISGGNDTVILDNNSSLSAAVSDSTLDLDKSWNVTEFNVFGGGGGDEAFFVAPSGTSPGTTIVVKTSVVDGTMNKPSCLQQSFTGESNNLTLAGKTSSTALVCCPFGGKSPNIQFMETNAGHTATCGATQLLGDPHITTVDGTHYNFQGAGEFVSLLDSDGAEIQTRQKPVSTTFIGSDSYNGLTTCVSLNTAVAARVGEHRVTWEPNLSGVPDPSGLQLRIDGALTSLGPQGVALGTGGRVAPQAGGALEVDFPDGKTLLATPEWWASQSEWYLNVNVSNVGLVSADSTAVGRGVAGAIASGSWLPALPGGASLGPMPATLPERYNTLYKKFADAWRVNNKDSLFDYAPGTSTDTFTNMDWPKEQPPCVVRNEKPLAPGSEALAQMACRRVSDQYTRADCIFDVRATGDPIFAQTYLVTQRVLADSTTTSLTADADPTQAGEWITFTAFVVANSSTATGRPSGTVQFAVDGSNAGEPVTVDAMGRATRETSQLKVGTHKVTASYIPGTDSVYLPSTSLEKLHTVKRCFCDAEHERHDHERE
ncbi:MAG: Ig-like domain-containing protein [Terracidiphilus sp.]